SARSSGRPAAIRCGPRRSSASIATRSARSSSSTGSSRAGSSPSQAQSVQALARSFPENACVPDARMSLERAVICPDNAGTLDWLGRLLNARRIARAARALTLGAVALSGTILLLAPVTAVSANEVPAGTLFDQGVKAFARGAFEEAASSWSGAAAAYEREQNRSARITALVHLAQSQSDLGQYRQAVGSLGAALELAEQLGDLRRIASIVAGLGNAHIALGPPETAAMYLDRALGVSRQTGDSTLTASILNNRGNLLVTQEKNAE